MMARYKSKMGVGDAPRGTPARRPSRPIAARHTGRIEGVLTRWKQRAAVHSTRHTLRASVFPKFSRITNPRRGFAVAFANRYNKELGIAIAVSGPPIPSRLKTAHTYGR